MPRAKKVNVDNAATEEKVENATENKIVDNSADVESLKKENAELKSQLQSILDKLSSLETQKEDTISNTKTDIADEVENYKEINPLKPIKVVSLTDGGVSLKTNASGSGKIFRFDKFGHSLSITYSDLQDIIATDRSFIENGYVYICDEDVIRNNYLDDYYNKFLTVDNITNILSFSKNDIVDMVSNTTEAIQETIISLIVRKINNNEYVDMNKVDAIGKSCKTPCDISTLALRKRVE